MDVRTLSPSAPSDQRGSALIGVLLLLMMMSALAAAFAVSGTTETLVVRNHQSAAQASAAAEAGLNHAVEAATAFLSDWKANGYASAAAAVDALLADLTLLEPGIVVGARIELADTGIEYQTFIMDEDDPARGDAATDLTGDTDAGNDEDAVAATDSNNMLIVRSTGYTPDGGVSTVEAVIAPESLPAIVTNGDLKISGNATISGKYGSVHTNADMDISGNPTVAVNATASGNYDQSGHPTIGGTSGGNRATVAVPEIRASDYRSYADYILAKNGKITYPSGAVFCDATAKKNTCEKDYGLKFKDDGKGWEIKGKTVLQGTFYVEGEMKIHDPGGSKNEKIVLSVIAEGTIELHANHRDITPDSQDLLFVTDGDLKVTGGSSVAMTAQGLVLVHEQVEVSGHPQLVGQILVEDSPSVDKTAKENKISGNPTITYNGGLMTGDFGLTGWRSVR